MAGALRTLTSTLLLTVALGEAAEAAQTRKVFVTCPIVRNTEVPCWLGRDAGTLYYIGSQGDLTSSFYPPQLQHRMLVEGEVRDGPAVCGGVPLDHVKVSVLPDLDPACNVMLPAEAYDTPPVDRGVGPSGVRGGQPPPPRERPAPEGFAPPFTVREFTAPFNADTERLWGPAQAALSDAVRYAAAAKASTVVITGNRAAIRLSNGTDYVERDDIAERRAQAVATAVRRLGLPPSTQVKVQWDNHANAPDGSPHDDINRRVTLKVTPP